MLSFVWTKSKKIFLYGQIVFYTGEWATNQLFQDDRTQKIWTRWFINWFISFIVWRQNLFFAPYWLCTRHVICYILQPSLSAWSLIQYLLLSFLPIAVFPRTLLASHQLPANEDYCYPLEELDLKLPLGFFTNYICHILRGRTHISKLCNIS